MEDIKREILKLLAELTSSKEIYFSKAILYKKRHFYYKIIITIISILAPAFVTYQAFIERSSLFAFIAIIITAIGGATATLHSVFNFNEVSVKNLNSYLSVDGLINKTQSEFERLEQLSASNEFASYKEYINLKENAKKEFIQIKRTHFEAEWQMLRDETKNNQANN